MSLGLIAPYIAVLLLAVAVHLGWRRRRMHLDAQAHALSIAAGLNEPASLHPVIDPARCIGSAILKNRYKEWNVAMIQQNT